MDEKNAPNRATEKPVEESFSSPGVEWNVNGKQRKARNPQKGKVRPNSDCLYALDCNSAFQPKALLIRHFSKTHHGWASFPDGRPIDKFERLKALQSSASCRI